MSTLNVKEINNEYINSLILDGTIVDTNATVVKQIAEFWSSNDMVKASKSASNVTEPWVPSTIGMGMWINNELIYKRDMPLKKSLVTSKRMATGIAKGGQSSETRQSPPTLWGPAIVEVRLWE